MEPASDTYRTFVAAPTRADAITHPFVRELLQEGWTLLACEELTLKPGEFAVVLQQHRIAPATSPRPTVAASPEAVPAG